MLIRVIHVGTVHVVVGVEYNILFLVTHYLVFGDVQADFGGAGHAFDFSRFLLQI
jgi:hypothetical protein